MRGPVTFGGTARAALPLAVLAFLVNGTVVAVALQAVGVPGDHPMIDFPALLPASIGPVVGSAVGFALSYRRPGRLSFLGFVTPAVVITAVFVWLAVADFADHDDVGVLVTALLVTVLPTAIAIVGLPRLTPRGPARAPAAADPSGAARTGIWEVPGLGAAWMAVEAMANHGTDFWPRDVPVVLAQLGDSGGGARDSGMRVESDRILLRVVGYGGTL